VLLACHLGVGVAGSAALERPRSEPGADPLARRQLGVCLGERSLACLAEVPPPAPHEIRQAAGDRQITDPHHIAILNRQRAPSAPPTASGPIAQLDLELKPPAMIGDRGHDQPVNPDKTANVILHPLFLLVRASTTRSLRGAADVSYPSLNPARSGRPQISTGEGGQFLTGADNRM
jgi:hypothetical protein